MTANEPDPKARPRRTLRLVVHVALWTALFYVLAVLVAKVAEWASR